MIVEPGFEDWTGAWRAANPDSLRLVRALVDEHPPNAWAYEVAHASPDGAPACIVPQSRQLGIAAQVYALWSPGSGGIGDLRDVAELASFSGAELLMLSPMHAPLPTFPQEPSPYFPSSRQYRNPLHLRLDGIELANDPSARIDRDEVWMAKRSHLEREWELFDGDVSFDAYCAREGDDLTQYATFNAACEVLGDDWRNWPSPLVVDPQRVEFHQWIQWRIDAQLRDAAAAGAGLVHDVAVGFDPEGADAWRWRDAIAPGMSVGAPPDEFNRNGQDWGVPPFVPQILAAATYRPIHAALSAAAAHGAGFRIDHVMGMFRLFWIPDGATPADGVYVRYPAAELLDVVAEVSQQSQAFVVGEDLGTVEPGVRDALAARGVLSYKVLWFERDEPADWPWLSLASVTTHDLPTIRGAGEDVDALHARILQAGSALVVMTAEDLAQALEQPNRPGTVDAANWSHRLPVPVDEIATRFATTVVPS